MNTVTTEPKLVTFGIGLAITFVIGAAIGMVDYQMGFAKPVIMVLSNTNVHAFG